MVGKNNEQIISANIEIEIETLEQIKILFGNCEPGNHIQLCNGNAELKLVSTGNSLAFDGGTTAELIISFTIGVTSGVIANAIYAALCNGLKKLEINGRRTRVKEESITEAIETVIKNETRSGNKVSTTVISRKEIMKKTNKKKKY